jgi:hypothetical protein
MSKKVVIYLAAAAMVPVVEFGSAISPCEATLGAELGKCDDSPGPHSRTVFVQQVASASGTVGISAGSYQYIDGEHVPPPDRWSPIATEPVRLGGPTGASGAFSKTDKSET